MSAQEVIRREWLANPDEFYFGGELVRSMKDATLKAAEAMEMHNMPNKPVDEEQPQDIGVLRDFSEHCCLVENATIAAAAVLQRWAAESRDGPANETFPDTVLTLNCSYAAVKVAIQEYCVRSTRKMDVAYVDVPFGDADVYADYESWKSKLMKNLQDELERQRPRFVVLDHITSQPAMKLPIREMVALCRQCPSVQEIAVDGSHAIGNLIPEEDYTETPTQIDADFYW